MTSPILSTSNNNNNNTNNNTNNNNTNSENEVSSLYGRNDGMGLHEDESQVSPNSRRFRYTESYDPLSESDYVQTDHCMDRRFRNPSGELSDYIRQSSYSPQGGNDWAAAAAAAAAAAGQHLSGGQIVQQWMDVTPPRGTSMWPPVDHTPKFSSPSHNLRWNEPPSFSRNKQGSRSSHGSTHNNPVDHIPDDTLAHLTVKELNKRVQNLNREEVVTLKQRRRTLKNRGYAMNCRLRRQHHKESLEVQNNTLKKDVMKLQSERDFYKNIAKNCRCQNSGNEPLDISHYHTNHLLTHQQLDLSLNTHDEYKRYSNGVSDSSHNLKTSPSLK